MKTFTTILIIVSALLLTGCNRSVESASQAFNALPPAVQKAVRAEAPDAEIATVSHKTRDGIEVYEVEFREAGKNPKMEIAADGKLLKTDLVKPRGGTELALPPTGAVGTKLSALPEAAQKTILSKTPNNAPIAGVMRHERNGKVVYEVEFDEPGTNSTIQVGNDGALVQDLQKKEPPPTVPNTAP